MIDMLLDALIKFTTEAYFYSLGVDISASQRTEVHCKVCDKKIQNCKGVSRVSCLIPKCMLRIDALEKSSKHVGNLKKARANVQAKSYA
jgi:hypothetical protein